MAETVSVTTSYEITQPTEGHYVIKQAAAEPQAELNSGNRKEFEWSFGPFSCSGYYDPDTQTIGVYPKIFGFRVGDGQVVNVGTLLWLDLHLMSWNGDVKFSKVGNEIKANLHLSPVSNFLQGPDVNFEGTIFSW